MTPFAGPEEKILRPAERKQFAGSRDFGIEIRTRIQEAFDEGRRVVLDLTGIEDMTPSFADECFGKLSEQLGEDVTERGVRIVNGDQFRSLINAVTRIRLQRALTKKK
jgi:STAS-like domain of unknown function (DUF4325)